MARRDRALVPKNYTACWARRPSLGTWAQVLRVLLPYCYRLGLGAMPPLLSMFLAGLHAAARAV